jgi:aminoglycoside phosphotransferase (APT) family kinase protein
VIEIPDLLATILPERFAGESMSVVRVQTTRPLFLVFGADRAHPACVVQLGGRIELERVHRTLTALHRRLPDLIPASLACAPWRGDTYAHVQAGLPGTTWFRIRERLETAADWLSLADRAAVALRRLHAATQASTEWRCPVNPAAVLRAQWRICAARHHALSACVAQLVADSADALEQVGDVSWFWQHGDFCVNNLLVTRDRVAIIDFEEFGQTAMPLHDEFSLALSLHAFDATRGNGPAELGNVIRARIRPTVVRHPWMAAHLTGLFLHHLVWRINQCGDRPGRAAACRHLVDLLNTFAAAPGDLAADARELVRAS